MKSSIEPKHKSFQSVRGAGQNLKKMLGQRDCPYVQSGVDIFHAFQPISETGRQLLIAGALDEYCRIIQWDLLSAGEIDTSKFSADCAMVSALNHDASRVFLVQSLLEVSESDLRSMFYIGKIVAEACALMGYEFVDHVAIVGERYFSLFERPEFAAFAKCLAASRERIGHQHNWNWTCEHCAASNVTTVAAMKGHRERPIQYARCIQCEERSWLSTMTYSRYQGVQLVSDLLNEKVMTE